MGESSGSVSIDVERISFGGKEHIVQTSHGSVSVTVFGDQEKPALVTYPDVALNYMSCFQGLFFCPEAASLLLHNFCIYHISPPGHEFGAAPISLDVPVPTVDDLADQVAEILDVFRLKSVMCMGVTAGAYILTLFASKYRGRVLGLMLVSPLCKPPSWSQWFYSKVPFDRLKSIFWAQFQKKEEFFFCFSIVCLFSKPNSQVMSNLLYFYGMCGPAKEFFLQRYFSKEVRGSGQVPESDIVQSCRSLLDERQSRNICRFLESMNGRYDLGEALKNLQCRTLIIVGSSSPFHSDALHMISKVDRRFTALVEVQACGSVVTEEQPHAMLIPMEYFLMGYGLYRPYQPSPSPRSPLSPSCFSPEMLSPESMGVRLKPIKTR